jgi:hypothetical protein
MTRFTRIRRSGLSFAALGIFSIFAAGCGSGGAGSSGGGGNNPPPPPAGDFSISASPASLTLDSGGSQIVTVSIAEVNTYTTSVTVSISGLPAGVTASPTTFSLSPGNQQAVTLNAAAAAATSAATITFQGTSGSLTHSASAFLSVVVPVTSAHAPIRTRYLRTNAPDGPDPGMLFPPHHAVYDAAHKKFFVSNPYLNEIDVFDATSETETAQISVPQPWGIDVSPYNGSLYVGTLFGDIYQVNMTTFSVMNRYPSASIGPDGFIATQAFVLSDGRLALTGEWLGPDGYGGAAVWDPVTNSLVTLLTNMSNCVIGGLGSFAVSGDRSRILLKYADTSGSAPVCSYDPIAGVATYGALDTPTGSFVQEIVPTPDGTRFFLTTATQGVTEFDARTAQILGTISSDGANGNIQLPSGAAGAVVSLDGTTLYLDDQSSGAVAAYDTASLALKGWIPNFITTVLTGVGISAIDETGLIVGLREQGVGFIDGSQVRTTEPTQIEPVLGPSLTGSLAGGTELSGFLYLFLGDAVSANATLSQIYVGDIPGSDASLVTKAGNYPDAHVTTPPSNQPGAVDLAMVLSDGAVGIVPEGFSYGPTILDVVSNGATADGGQTGKLVGYGLGDSKTGVSVVVGGQVAPLTAIYSYPAFGMSSLFPSNTLQFTIPPGTAGTVDDVSVLTSSGSATAKGAIHYTAAAQSFPVTANLQSGIYDAGRDLYYFADQAQIQVLSKSAGKWLTPIALPGVTSQTQLLAISESPDGTKLAVSDFGDQTIYVFNPDSPSSVARYPMSLDGDGFSSSLAPSGLAITDTGIVYFSTCDIRGSGTPSFHKLDISRGSIIDLGNFDDGDLLCLDGFDRVLLSPDGSKIYSSADGDNFWLDTSNDQIHGTFNAFPFTVDYAVSLAVNTLDVAISGDGNTVDVDGNLTDSKLNEETEPAYNDFEWASSTPMIGQKLNRDGSILFQPLTDGIDLIARNTGRLLYRVQIPVTPANVYDPLLVAEGKNTLAIITVAGVSFVDLSSLPIPSEYAQPFAVATHSKAGRLANVRTVPAIRRLSPNRSVHPNARPRLKRWVAPIS